MRSFVASSLLVFAACRGGDGAADTDDPCATDACSTGAGTDASTSDASTSASASATASASTSTTSDEGTTTTGDASSSSETSGGSSSSSESSTGEPAGPSSSRHTPIPLGSTDAPQGFWEYLPPGYEGGGPFPLLLFHHGIGANGNGSDQLDLVLEGGPPYLIDRDEWPNDRPFVVLSPQWSQAGCPSGAAIQAFTAWAIEHYDVDPAQVYLTGLSCGAIGSWNYLGAYGDTQFAAAVLIAGDGRNAFTSAGCDLGSVPIWAFHGDADGTVPVEGTTVPIEGLLMCEPTPDVQMTIYPGVGHNSWSATYDLTAGHDIYAWLLAH